MNVSEEFLQEFMKVLKQIATDLHKIASCVDKRHSYDTNVFYTNK